MPHSETARGAVGLHRVVRGLRRLAALACVPAFASFAPIAQAAYPDHPIRLIVPFAPGGGNDNVARTVGKRLGEILGQAVIVDNRAGAGGTVVAILPHVKDGSLVALGVTGTQRLPALPDVPTIAESAVPGYESSSWYGILAPAGTPRGVVLTLNKALNQALQAKQVHDTLTADGALPAGGTPEEFGDYIRREKDRLGEIIRTAGIHLE
jgi:tripartite-type tricarboxylate transporter receptor subunit TctC